jgi:molybdopterin converting factor small subunit
MRIHIFAFGIAKDILNQQKLVVDLDASHSVNDLRNKLLAAHPDFQKLSSLRFAVNEEYVDDSYDLCEGDEVILIPPVSGG